MILSYGVRLVCLSLAVFLLVHTLISIVASLIGPAALRLAERIRPRNAARLLLALRLMPAAVSIFIVAAFCIPSYLSLETEAGGEQIGLLCAGAAIAAAAMWAVSATNLVRALIRSARFTRHCERTGAPVIMLTGILRPRLVISQAVRRALSASQLEAARRHEQAHRNAHDNFKRCLIAGTPRMPGFAALERGWSRFSEWAADDESVAANPTRALCLADALVRVARLGAIPAEVSLLGDGRDLAVRVDRLLHPRVYGPPRGRWFAMATMAGVVAVGGLLALQQPLESAHEWLERLAH
ncbi:MAG TPA: hypothetical protein VKE70_38880 [Candidatus Solibacter sp.]|nr:hypothetical protein [Candidatus Solibacter sp.]